jgi:FixJ family two-component response regulator
VAELFAAGTVPMLEKPFTQAALATSVRRAIDGTAAPPA